MRTVGVLRVVVAAVLAVGLAGCSDGDESARETSVRTIPPAASRSAAPANPEPETVVLRAVDARGAVQSGWTSRRDNSGTPLDCEYSSWSPYDVGTGVRWCGGTADAADACWPAGRDELFCLRDPFSRNLDRLAAVNTGEPVGEREQSAPRPFGLLLDDGTQCRARIGGAWPSPVDHPDWVGHFGCGEDRAVWAPGDTDGVEKGPDGWWVLVGPSDGRLKRQRVTQVVYVGMA